MISGIMMKRGSGDWGRGGGGRKKATRDSTARKITCDRVRRKAIFRIFHRAGARYQAIREVEIRVERITRG